VTLNRIMKAVAHRSVVVARYAAGAPGAASMGEWLALGAIRARLTGGEARLQQRADGTAREFSVRVGKDAKHRVILDLSSMAELDGFEEIFVRRIYDLAKLPFRPSLVADCGANIGLFASLCRMAWPEASLCCWEPEPRNFARLSRQPLLQAERCELNAAAVFDRDGELSFSGSGLGGHVVEDGMPAASRVRAVDFSAWLAGKRSERALVKIDIEGYEERLVPSLAGTWPDTCALFMETHQEEGKDRPILDALRSEGFRWERLGTHDLPGDRRMFNEYYAVRGA